MVEGRRRKIPQFPLVLPPASLEASNVTDWPLATVIEYIAVALVALSPISVTVCPKYMGIALLISDPSGPWAKRCDDAEIVVNSRSELKSVFVIVVFSGDYSPPCNCLRSIPANVRKKFESIVFAVPTTDIAYF